MNHHNHHSKQFSAKNWQKLIDETRHHSMSVEPFFEQARPTEKEVWLDFGAGPGYFTLPLAANVRTVIAADISDEMLTVCRQRAQEASLTNIEFVKIENSRLPLASGSVDKILLSNVFHELENPQADLQELHRVLKEGGRVFVVDWRAQEMEMGPPLHHRLPEDRVKKMVGDAGFKFEKEWNLFEFHYVLVFAK